MILCFDTPVPRFTASKSAVDTSAVYPCFNWFCLHYPAHSPIATYDRHYGPRQQGKHSGLTNVSARTTGWFNLTSQYLLKCRTFSPKIHKARFVMMSGKIKKRALLAIHCSRYQCVYLAHHNSPVMLTIDGDHAFFLLLLARHTSIPCTISLVDALDWFMKV